MKKLSTVIVGLSLLASSTMYANGHQMQSHDNMKDMKQMDHSNMSNMNHGNMTNKSMGAFHEQMMSGEYHVSLNSKKPLVTGNNHMSVMLMKDGKPVTDAKVKIKFFMPEMPGMPYMEYKTKAKKEGNQYNCNVNFAMSGTWQYQLKFKTSDEKIHTVRGSVNQ